MKLKDVKTIEIRVPNRSKELENRIIRQFRIGSDDAKEILEFAIGERALEDLSDVARAKLFSYYENQKDAVASDIDPQKLLKKDLSL